MTLYFPPQLHIDASNDCSGIARYPTGEGAANFYMWLDWGKIIAPPPPRWLTACSGSALLLATSLAKCPPKERFNQISKISTHKKDAFAYRAMKPKQLETHLAATTDIVKNNGGLTGKEFSKLLAPTKQRANPNLTLRQLALQMLGVADSHSLIGAVWQGKTGTQAHTIAIINGVIVDNGGLLDCPHFLDHPLIWAYLLDEVADWRLHLANDP